MCLTVSPLPTDLSAVCFRIMCKGACIPQVSLPFTVQLLLSSLPTSFSPYQPHCPSYEKWRIDIHRKLLWVIFLVANPNNQEDPDSVTTLKQNLWRRKVLAVIFIFLRRKLMQVGEVRFPLTEKFQEEIGLPQSNISLLHPSSPPQTSQLAKPRNSDTPLFTSSCSDFTNH